MAEPCIAAFDSLARALGDFTCADAPAVIHLRNPLALSNWTLPVLEVMMVTGAVLALWYSIRRWRRDGDPINLALWCATVLYLFVIEIPLYFPNISGVEESLGIVFVHNAFTVQFLFERLPLYIVALYPAVVTLAYEIVRSLGVFRDRGAAIGAICVGFIHHCLYEVFDQLGPQLRWWAWNTDNPLNDPRLASVPMTSVWIFAALGPVVVTLLVLYFLGRGAPRGWSLGWRIAVAGALTPVGIALLSLPSSLFGGPDPNTTAQAIIYTVELVVLTAIAGPVLVRQWKCGRRNGADEQGSPFVRVFGPMYLGVLCVLWIAALPAYFGAVDGITADGTPIGSLPYAAVSFIVAACGVGAASTVTSRATRIAESGDIHEISAGPRG